MASAVGTSKNRTPPTTTKITTKTAVELLDAGPVIHQRDFVVLAVVREFYGTTSNGR
jgi:hypothetical protein